MIKFNILLPLLSFSSSILAMEQAEHAYTRQNRPESQQDHRATRRATPGRHTTTFMQKSLKFISNGCQGLNLLRLICLQKKRMRLFLVFLPLW